MPVAISTKEKNVSRMQSRTVLSGIWLSICLSIRLSIRLYICHSILIIAITVISNKILVRSANSHSSVQNLFLTGKLHHLIADLFLKNKSILHWKFEKSSEYEGTDKSSSRKDLILIYFTIFLHPVFILMDYFQIWLRIKLANYFVDNSSMSIVLQEFKKYRYMSKIM